MKNFDATSKKFSWLYPSGHRLLHSPSLVAVGLASEVMGQVSVPCWHGLKLAGITLLWLVGQKIDWDCPVPHCIMGSNDQWEFQLFFRPLWQSLCTATACGGGWGCEVSCGGHHRPRGKTTTGSALDGAVFDIAQILAYLVHNMSRSQLYLGFGHFGWLPSFFGQ